MKHRLRGCCCICLILMIVSLTGCSDMVQIEDRDFVMSFAISHNGQQYEMVFQRPDLQSLTGQGVTEEKELLLTYSGDSISKIKEQYAKSSEKRLDFSHLKAIIIDYKIAGNQKKMKEFLQYIEKDYEISRNTLVFFTLEDEKEISGKIGEELELSYQNNSSNMDIKKAAAGDMIDCLYQEDKVIAIPIIDLSKDHISLDGAGLFRKNLYIDRISETELTEWNMLQGKGSSRYLSMPEGEVVKLKDVKAGYQYSMADGTPYIRIRLEGQAELTESGDGEGKNLEAELNTLLKEKLERQMHRMMKENQTDYLNLYRKMSYKNRKMWMKYQGNQGQFLNEVIITVDTQIKIEK